MDVPECMLIRIFTATYFVLDKSWKQLKCPFTVGGLNKLEYMNTMELHVAKKIYIIHIHMIRILV